MKPDPTILIEAIGITNPLIGIYDAPNHESFAPLVTPKHCLFSCYSDWLEGRTAHLQAEKFGCRGAGYSLCGVESWERDKFVKFLADDEGLKASHDLMNQWLDHRQPYRPEHPHILIGPMRADQYDYLKTVTFFVNPDQLCMLTTGAQYHAAPDDPAPVIAPFGSGCSQLVSRFEDLGIPQAIIGATDIAMRKYLPPDVMAFTATRPMFERLCTLDEKSFLFKPFWRQLQKARKSV
jgi:hypothetical protein